MLILCPSAEAEQGRYKLSTIKDVGLQITIGMGMGLMEMYTGEEEKIRIKEEVRCQLRELVEKLKCINKSET